MRFMWFVLAAVIAACVQTSDGVEARGVTIATMRCGQHWRQLSVSAPRPRVFSNVTETPIGVVITGGFGSEGVLDDAWRWDGAAWTPLPIEGAPSARSGHVAVWTGTQLCVWGGEGDGAAIGDGACWTPGESRWQPIATEGAPAARIHAGAAMVGHELVIFGGQDAQGEAFGDGAAWDATTNRWRPLASTGAPRPRVRPLIAPYFAPDGARALVWGGSGDELALGAEDAAFYDLTRDRWIPIDLTGAPTASSGPLSTLIPEGVWALNRDGVHLFDGATLRWRALRNDDGVGPRFATTPARLPGGVWLWGGRDERGLLGDGGCYDPNEQRWARAPGEGAPSPRQNAVTFWDGHRMMVLWGEDDDGLRDDAFALEL